MQELQNEFNELKIRADKVGYKNGFPKLPKTNRQGDMPPYHLMVGFYKRFSNWKSCLVQIENPGGIKQFPLKEKEVIIEQSSIEQLLQKFENN